MTAPLTGIAAPPHAAVGPRLALSITTGLFAAMMTLSGVLYVVRPQPVLETMHALGYPPYFTVGLGIAKVLGAIALVNPRWPTLRESAYAGFTFDLVGGVVSHLAIGEASHVAPPIFALALLLASHRLRRRVEATAR